ncbi:MAG: hypothetical protein AAGH64_07810 [Planctomycetota bacterium]
MTALIAVTIASALLGAWLLRRAFTKRTGTTRRCRRCDHPLPDGLDTCTECGHELDDKGPAIGDRALSLPRLALALPVLLVCLVTLSTLVYRVRGGNIYPHLPTPLVITAAEYGSADAFSELRLRVTSGAADEHAAEVLDLSLASIVRLWPQNEHFPPKPTEAWAEIVAELSSRGLLDETDHARILRDCVRTTLQIPERVHPDDRLVPTLFVSSALSNVPFVWPAPGGALTYQSSTYTLTAEHDIGAIRVDGIATTRERPRQMYGFAFGSHTSAASSRPAHSARELLGADTLPGTKSLAVDITLRLTDGTPSRGKAITALAETKRTLEARFDYADASEEPTPIFNDDIALARAFFGAFTFTPSVQHIKVDTPVSRKWRIGHTMRAIAASTGSATPPRSYPLRSHPLAYRRPEPVRHPLLSTNPPGSQVTAVQRLDIVVLPDPDAYAETSDPPVLGFGARFEGLVFDPANPSSTPITPRRIVLLDADGNDIEELAIPRAKAP